MSEDKKDDFLSQDEIHQKTVELNVNQTTQNRGNKTTENYLFPNASDKENAQMTAHDAGIEEDAQMTSPDMCVLIEEQNAQMTAPDMCVLFKEQSVQTPEADISVEETSELDKFMLRNASRINNSEHNVTRNLNFPKIPEVEITSIIGEGGMGFVFKGKQTYIDRDVAIKIMKSNSNASFTERFKREAKILASLSHPNIVSCYHAGVTEQHECYIIMEFIEGQELHSYVVENGPLPEKAALYVVECLAQALQYAWEKGVMHRDIKAENVLLQKIDTLHDTSMIHESFPYKIKLVDLGFSKDWEGKDGQKYEGKNITQVGYIVGTPSNMAPEQFESDTIVDYRADIYALGCMLFFLLTGKRAYKSTSIVEMIKDKLTRPIPDPGELSDKLSQKIRDFNTYLLQSDIEKRPQSYEEIVKIAHDIGVFKIKKNLVPKKKKTTKNITINMDTVKYVFVCIVIVIAMTSYIFIFKNNANTENTITENKQNTENTITENKQNTENTITENKQNTQNDSSKTRSLVWNSSYTSLFENDYLSRLKDWQTDGVWASYEEGQGAIGQRTGSMFHVLPQAPWRIEGKINSLNANNREFGISIVFSEISYAIRIQSITDNLFIVSVVENQKLPLKSIKATDSQFSYRIYYDGKKLSFAVNDNELYETLCMDLSIKIESFVKKVQSVHFETIKIQQGRYE